MWNHNGVQNDKTNMTGCMVISNLSSKRDYVSSQSGSARERERERGRCPMPQGHGAKLMTFLRHISSSSCPLSSFEESRHSKLSGVSPRRLTSHLVLHTNILREWMVRLKQIIMEDFSQRRSCPFFVVYFWY